MLSRKLASPSSLFQRSGGTIHLVIIALIAIALVGSGVLYAMRGSKTAVMDQPITSQVSKGKFVSHVLDQGEIQSSENVEIRCQVEARGGNVTVLSVIPEGTMVDEGTVLVELDKSSFEQQKQTQDIAVANAKTRVIQADAAYKTAVQAKREYTEGTFVEQKIQIENEIYTAEQQFQQAEAVVKHSEKLQKKGIVTAQQMKTDLIAVQQAKNSLALAKKKLWVLENITKQKEEIKLAADIEAAKVKFDNEKEAEKVELDQLKEIEEQIANCTIRAPKGTSKGQVVYAKQYSRGGQTEWVLEEGATVRERQVLIRLPTPSKMQVKAAINEQSIAMIEKGMLVDITVDALPGARFKGVVTSVSQYAESQGWMSSSIPKFPVYIKILKPTPNLKANMNASVSIQTQLITDCLQVPVQCIYSAQDKHFCLIKNGENSWETQEVEVLTDNSTNAVIKGLEEGTEVALNPGAYKELLELPEFVVSNDIELTDEEKAELEKEKKAAKAEKGKGKGKGKEKGKGKGKGGGKSGDERLDSFMTRVDKNGDKVIDEEELKESGRMAGFIKNADANKDKKITRQELKTYFEKMMKQYGGGRGGKGGGRGGPGGGRGGRPGGGSN